MEDHPHHLRKRRIETPYSFRKRLEHEAMRDMRPSSLSRRPIRRARPKNMD